MLQAFRETLGGEPHLTFNPGVFVGGTAADLDLAWRAAPPRARRTSSPRKRR